MLESEGLVLSDRWRRTIVAPLDVRLIRDVYDFRGIIEREVASSLAARRDLRTEKIRKIVNTGREAARHKKISRLVALDLEFHTALYDATGNGVLSEVMRGQWTHIRRVMGATLKMAGYPQQVWEEHGAILEAIEEHNVDLAGVRSLDHTRSASVRLIENLQKQLESERHQHEQASRK